MNTTTEMQISVLTDWRDDFRIYLKSQNCSSATVKAYCQDLAHFSHWFERINGQDFAPELITGVDLRSYRSEAMESHVAPSTFNRRRACLRRMCDWAMVSGFLSYDPFQGIEPMKQEDPPLRWLSDSEYHRLVRQLEMAVNGANTEYWRIQAARDQAMLSLMLYAGLREVEVCSLDWNDIQIGERKGKAIVRRGKGDKKREVPLNAEMRRALIYWKQVSGCLVEAVFTGKGSQRIGVRTVQERTAAIRQAAGLDDSVTPHSLRHTFAKRLLDSGSPLTVVKKLLGHARLETTYRYVQPGWSDLEKSVERL